MERIESIIHLGVIYCTAFHVPELFATSGWLPEFICPSRRARANTLNVAGILPNAVVRGREELELVRMYGHPYVRGLYIHEFEILI
jgi:hypothetical protein